MKELKLVYDEAALTDDPHVNELANLSGMKIIELSYCHVHKSLSIIAIPVDENMVDSGCMVKGLYETADRIMRRSQIVREGPPAQEHQH